MVVKRVVFTTLTLFMISYIFVNSSFDAVASDAQSLGIRKMINDMLHSLHINITFSDYFVRKCAHFIEFFLLGCLLFCAVNSYTKKMRIISILAPAIGLVVAATDETIQLFSEGRSAQFSDVLLDFSGICTAVVVLCLILKMRKSKKDEEGLDE